jgi:hypothetical protein
VGSGNGNETGWEVFYESIKNICGIGIGVQRLVAFLLHFGVQAGTGAELGKRITRHGFIENHDFGHM